MATITARFERRLIALGLLLLCAAFAARAQFNQGGGGRPQGINRATGGAGGGARTTGAGGGAAGSTRQYYPPGTVGEAIVTSDPETRRLIVITDEETSQYVSQVVTNLDRPKPQVLIKVVFLELTHSAGSDIGIEGGYQKTFGF